MLKRLLYGITLYSSLFVTPLFTQAAHGSYHNPIQLMGVDTIPKFLLALVDLALLVGVPIIVICIIYSGFLFVTGGDNEAKVQKARFVFMWTIIGGIVLLASVGISKAIEATVLSLK